MQSVRGAVLKSCSFAVRFLVLLLFAASGPIVLYGETTPSFTVSAWSEKDGLPHNTINAMLQTSDHYVWIGTDAGLVRWDGYTMTIFSIWNTPALKSDRVLSLYEEPAGTLWIGTAGGGLYSLRSGAFLQHHQAPFLTNATVRAIVSDLNGSLWAGTEFGLYRLDGSGIRRYSINDGLPDNIITSLCRDSSGRIWAGTLRGGAAVINADLVQVYGREEGLTNTAVLSLAADQSGRVWIGTIQGLFSVAPDEQAAQLKPGLSYTPVSAILPDGKGMLWVGTMADGLQQLQNDIFEAPAALPDNHITCLCRIGDMLFAGTAEQGVSGIRRGIVHRLPVFGTRNASCLLTAPDGTLWAGSEDDGLFGLQRGRVITRYTGASGLAGNRVRSLLRDNQGRIWAADADGGASWIDDNGAREIGALSGVRINEFWRNGGSDTVWAAAADGLHFYYGGAWGRVASLSGKDVRTLSGYGAALFVATENTLYRRSGDMFRQLTIPSGEPAFSIQALYADDTGALWIGTGGSGLKRWRDGGFTTFSTLNGLPDNVIFSIIPGRGRTLWLGSRNGLFRLHRDSLAAVAEHRLSAVHPVWITTKDGLPYDLCSGCSPAAAIRDSLFFAATRQGIGVFNLSALERDVSVPRCRVVSVMADGRPVAADSVTVLPQATRHVLVELTAFDWGHAEKLRFRYYLQGADTVYRYINPGKKRIAEYRDLPAGTYRFTAAAVSDRAVISDTCSLTLILSKGSSFNGLAIVALLFAAAGAITLLFFWRRRQPAKPSAEKYKTTPVDPERVNITTERLRIYMDEDKLFLDPDLSLKALAKALKIHPNHLSRIINEQFAVSFNDYINKFRIDEAMRKLSDPALRETSILDIMYECGFYSKSVFNTAFKKFAGTTPSAFRRSTG